MSSAFPSVDVDSVLKKMEAIGVQQNSLKWFANYFDYRIVTTKVDDEISDKIKTEKQVSEGSALSSTIFILQVCDINEYLQYATSSSFADDQTQAVSHNDIDVAIKRAEIDANAVVNYFKANKFKVQPSKTSMIIIRAKRAYNDKKKREILVDSKKIKESSNFKMLGLIIDFQLKFESHCNKIIANLDEFFEQLNVYLQ